MKGIYRFYQHGRLVAAVPNLITTRGAEVILRALAGESVTVGASIGVGLGATAPTVADRRLTYEVERATVTVSSSDVTTGKTIFKARLSQGLQTKIYEVGLFNTEFPLGSRALVNFSADETWTSPTFNATNARNGLDALRVSVAANGTTTQTISNLGLDLSSFSTIDEFILAYHYVSNTSSIRIRFLNEDGTSYYQYTFTPTTGYNVKTFTKNDMTKVGNVDYSAIASIEFAVSATAGGTAVVDFDGLRIEDKDFIDPRAVLVSRSVLTTPVTKTGVAPMDVEYGLDTTI